MTINGLKQHEVSYRLSKPKNVFECKMCSYRTQRKGNLDRHLYDKHGVQFNEGKGSFQIGFGMCEECYEKVASEFGANDKISRVFLCHCCPYLTSTIIRLQNHIKRKHEIVMEHKKYKCSLCKYRTDRPSMIQRHKDKIHKDVCNNQVIKKCLESNNKIFSEKDIDDIVNE